MPYEALFALESHIVFLMSAEDEIALTAAVSPQDAWSRRHSLSFGDVNLDKLWLGANY